MAHKTLIDGTNYEIIGGKTLVDGTAYAIKGGKTCVGGTNYEVWLEKRANVLIRRAKTAIGTGTYAIVTINEKNYTEDEDLTLPIGTIAVCSVEGNGSVVATITHNGKVVAQIDKGIITYEHPITNDTTIVNRSYYLLGIFAKLSIYDNGHIAFIHNTTDYMAHEGMTWSEWIGSESYILSNATFVIKDGLVYPNADSETPVRTAPYSSKSVKGTDIIVSGHTYG